MNLKTSNSKILSFVFRYGLAVVLVGTALGITLFIWTFVRSFASPLFLMAVLVTAWKGGIRPGVFATLLSGLAINYFFITPEFQLSGHLDDVSRLLIFTLEGYAFCWLISSRTTASEEIRESRENLRALSLRQQTLLEQERKRIALEIHDELGQFLTGLKMEIHMLSKQIARKENQADSEHSGEKIKEILQLIDNTILTVRRIATELRPAVLDDLGLIAAIEWQGQEFQRRTGIPCKLSTNVENVNLKPDFATAVFRIFQETLTNVTRHANARLVVVNLNQIEEQLILRVEDDGKGIEMENVDQNGSLGILGMKERARLIGAELQVQKGNKMGTIVELTAPLL